MWQRSLKLQWSKEAMITLDHWISPLLIQLHDPLNASQLTAQTRAGLKRLFFVCVFRVIFLVGKRGLLQFNLRECVCVIVAGWYLVLACDNICRTWPQLPIFHMNGMSTSIYQGTTYANRAYTQYLTWVTAIGGVAKVIIQIQVRRKMNVEGESIFAETTLAVRTTSWVFLTSGFVM